MSWRDLISGGCGFRSQLRAAMYRVMQRIRQGDADVPFNGFTKNAYDIAYRIVVCFCFMFLFSWQRGRGVRWQ